MHTNRWTAVAIGLAAMYAAGLSAQTQETKTTTNTKIEIKDGKDVRVSGCLERRPNGAYILAHVRDKGHHEPSRYALVTNEDLSKHLGARVEIHGNAVDKGHGTISVESKTRTEVENGKDQETKMKTQGTSDEADMAFIGVKSMKVLASSCN